MRRLKGPPGVYWQGGEMDSGAGGGGGVRQDGDGETAEGEFLCCPLQWE